MPRKRTISDEALLDAALALVREAGPEGLTFSTLSSRVGLAGSTIVQRFKSKPDLLRAALLRAWDRLDEDTATAIEAAPSGPSGVTELLVRLSGQYEAHDYADQLRLLREDLRDPVLTARGRAWLATLSDAIEARLADGPATVAGLGPQILAQWQGTLTIWSFTRQEPIQAMVRRNLDDLLEGLLKTPRRPKTPRGVSR
jgi:AcrR family transcriptional regulator